MLAFLHLWAALIGAAILVLLFVGIVYITGLAFVQAISLTAVQVVAVFRHGRVRSPEIKWWKLPLSFFENFGYMLAVGDVGRHYNQYYEWKGTFKFKIYPRENHD